ANHAAEALVIYPLARPGAPGLTTPPDAVSSAAAPAESSPDSSAESSAGSSVAEAAGQAAPPP
ncbi:MAG: hypothetical protein ACKOTB_16960, partial [Planctomycetia bacterium]